MKILFVSSGNSGKTSILVQRQAESLINQGMDIDYYLVKGKGIIGYLKNIVPLRKFLKKNQFDIIHAHYSLSAFVASLAGARPLVVSLMGSDVKSGGLYKNIIRIFKFFFSWSALIVKSEDMKTSLGFEDAYVIPNGVNLEHFKPIPANYCKEKLSWSNTKRHILFAADPTPFEKNYQFALAAFDLIKDDLIEFHVLEGVDPEKTPIWFNAADIIILTSLWEGSPNVIKEAMACNCPIVSTDVGDVKWVIGNTEGCFISSFDVTDFSSKINDALSFAERLGSTKGRTRVIEIGIDAESVAKKIIEIYNKLMS